METKIPGSAPQCQTEEMGVVSPSDLQGETGHPIGVSPQTVVVRAFSRFLAKEQFHLVRPLHQLNPHVPLPVCHAEQRLHVHQREWGLKEETLYTSLTMLI